MKKRGLKYLSALKRLKALRNKDRLAYKKLMQQTCRHFSISVKTIYRDMKKKHPGTRKARTDRGKPRSRVTKTEIKIAEEIMSSGKTKKTAKSVIEKKTGNKVSDRRLKKITARLPEPSKESFFGKEAKEFFEELFELSLIGEDRLIKIKAPSPRGFFCLNKNDLRDLVMILTNAFNRHQYKEERKLKLDRDELRKHFIMHLVEMQMNIARDNMDYKLVEALTRMLDRLEEKQTLPDDFETVVKVCAALKPDISKMDVIRLIKKAASDG